MKKAIILVILFVLQTYLILKGVSHLDKLVNPFALFAVSMAIALYCLSLLLKEKDDAPQSKPFSFKNLAIGATLGLISITVFYKELRSLFDEFKDYTSMSDVIAQLETLYTRFSSGIFPYAPLEQYPWHPYPVYLPLNWLPVGLASLLHCDVRWIGILFLGIAFVLWGIYVFRVSSNTVFKGVSILLPTWVLWSFLHWNRMEMAGTLETLIAAYYLILAVGLFSRNLLLVTIGIICCLLSRYTMIFWLPLFFLLLWLNDSKKKSFLIWAGIVAVVLLFYILPFYIKDPSILTDGIAYHNHCYVDAWNGLGHPEDATVFNDGLNFSWFIREFTSGTMEHRVFVGRVIQASLMLLLLFAGWLGYKKWKLKINFYDYSLLMLYVFLLVFFMFSPLTYKYYFMPFLMVSAVLIGRVLIAGKSKGRF